MENELKKLTILGQKVKAKTLHGVTPSEKITAEAMMTLEAMVMKFILDGLSIRAVIMSLYYFWFILEAPLYQLEVNDLPEHISILDSFSALAGRVQLHLSTLPNPPHDEDYQALAFHFDELKPFLATSHTHQQDIYSREAPPAQDIETINQTIHQITSELLLQDIHPQIIGALLCLNWLRLSTLIEQVPEAYYQKIDYYFEEMIQTLREGMVSFMETYTDSKEGNINLSQQNKREALRLIQSIDSQVKHLYQESGDEALLHELIHFMEDIPVIMKALSQEELDGYVQHYKGFYKVMALLQNLAEGIQAGNIKVPQTH